MANPNVNSLPAYVDQNSKELITKAVLGGKSVKLFNIQTGVTGPTAIQLLTGGALFQNGAECGFTPAGTQSLSQRIITPAIVKVNMEYCPKNLLGKWAQSEVRIAAGLQNMPFEEQFIDEVIKDVNAKIERGIFAGFLADSGLADFDSELGDTLTAQAGDSTYQSIVKLYLALPADVANKEDVAIITGSDVYRQAVQDLVAANLYHYDANDAGEYFYLPGTKCKVINCPGLTTDGAAYALSLSNVVVGVDMLGDEEKFDFWYSKDNDVYRLNIQFAIGVNYAYPDEVVKMEGLA